MSKSKPMPESDAVVESPAAAADPRKPIEFWAEVLGTPDWLFAGVKAGKQWPIGQEVTREDYEAAIKWATSFACR